MRKPSHSSPFPKTIHIKDIHVFMYKHIDLIIGVKGDVNCVYYVVSTFLGKIKRRQYICSTRSHQRVEYT